MQFDGRSARRVYFFEIFFIEAKVDEDTQSQAEDIFTRRENGARFHGVESLAAMEPGHIVYRMRDVVDESAGGSGIREIRQGTFRKYVLSKKRDSVLLSQPRYNNRTVINSWSLYEMEVRL